MSKTVTDNQLNGEVGETLVKAKIGRLGHVFEGRGRLETGIDGTVEFRDVVTGQMTGNMVFAQVKTTAGKKYPFETDRAFEYPLRADDVAYWRSLSLPVVIVLYRDSDETYFWKNVADTKPGDDNRLVFDKAADLLDSASITRMAGLAVQKGRLGAFVPPMRGGEAAHLNLMRIVLPDEIFVADSPFASGRDAVPEVLRTDERRFDWVIRGRRFVSFRDPRGTGLEAIVDPDTVEAVETELIADSDDPDDELVMIELLRRTMVEQESTDLAFAGKSRVFYFRTAERYQPREYEYRSLRANASAMVVQVYMNKKRKDQVHSVRHHAFRPRFERIAGEWFLSISPTFVFTEDGFRPHRFAADLLAGKKRMDRNGSIRGQVFMFRYLLSGEQRDAHSPSFDLFGTPAVPERPERLLKFEPVDAVQMDVAVPEAAWVANDPNAKKMAAENDDGLFQPKLEVQA